MKLRIWLILGIVLFSLGYFAFQANRIPYPPNSSYSDFAITHFPNLRYLQDSIRQYRQVPLWSNSILGGYPYDANPLSSLWYLPYWVSVIFPAQIGLNLLVIAHLVWGAVGMYSFLLRLNQHRFGALMAAMAFMWMPKIFAHWGSGHITLVWAVCWTPWLLYSMQEQFSTEKIQRILPGIVLGLIFLADPRWIVWAGILYVIYSCCVFLRKNPLIRVSLIKDLTGLLLQLGTTLILALLVSAPLLLPLAQYASLSTRSMMDISSQLLYSLPVNHLLGVIIPDFGGFSEWISYFGIVPLFGMIYGVAHRKIRPKILPWVVGFIICFLFALGDQTPFASMIMRLPVFEWQRVPTRILFLAGVFLAIILSNVISEILKDEDESGFDPIFFLVIPTIFLILFFLVIQLLNKEKSIEFIWATIVSVLGVLTFWLIKKNKKLSTMILLGFLMLFDLIGSDIQMIEFRLLEEEITPNNITTQLLSESGELFRVYSPSYSIPQEIAATEQIQLLNGIDPMQLRQTVDYMEAATGVPMDRYSVTMPPYKTGHPEVDNQEYLPDARLLGKMNVKYVVSEFPIHSNGLNPINPSGIPYIYQNQYYLPRVYLINDNHDVIPVDVRYYSPNQIVVSADRAGTIVFADVMYPGWICKVDGVPNPLKSYDGLFRSVIVNDGNHMIELNYRPILLYIGLAISMVTWVLLVAILLNYLKRKKHHVV